MHDTVVVVFRSSGSRATILADKSRGDAASITACASSYGAMFPLMEKVGVIDNDAQCAIYHDLAEATGALPEWNFGKYLIDQNGTPTAFFGSNVEPLSPELTDRIETLLAAD